MKYILILILLIPIIGQSQEIFERKKHDYIWLFGGNNLKLDFNMTPPVFSIQDREFNFDNTNTSICNDHGELLFYSNGVQIANNLHQYLENGYRINPGDYVAANEQLNGLFQYSETSLSNMATYWDGFQDKLKQMRLIEQELLTVNNEADSLVLVDDYQTAAENLGEHLVDIQTLQANIAEARNVATSGVIVTNNDLATAYLLAENQKVVANLYLERLAGSIEEFTAVQVIQLEDIAYQCPKEGGNAVYRARALLKTVDSYVFTDDQDCTKELKQKALRTTGNTSAILEADGLLKKQVSSNNGNWTIYPNPTSSQFYLEGGAFENVSEINLISLTGKKLQKWPKTAIHSASLNINTELADGIYLVSIQLQDGSFILRKLVISK